MEILKKGKEHLLQKSAKRNNVKRKRRRKGRDAFEEAAATYAQKDSRNGASNQTRMSSLGNKRREGDKGETPSEKRNSALDSRMHNR